MTQDKIDAINAKDVNEFFGATISAYQRTYECIEARLQGMKKDEEQDAAKFEKLVLEHSRLLLKIKDQEKLLERARGDVSTGSAIDLDAARAEIIERLARTRN